ncbi:MULTISPECIES: hypothetical protein [Sorangium]|uniref:Uncharacterized protein n=1 Tax=Sorangium cellulosum TaxID=56 RepID=A0A4V0NG22_SORCE|nr:MULTISPECIES: hypothetical protein [Sorangium]AUX31662.1 hypothetical protein SOCE836_037930 [Sorangium cellulosum]WCQ91039.1 hypothetical protein NQZ70_03754 [Sorangium sp. Soce836]
MLGERLAAALGAARDGAAGIESFAHLLGSRRVGPRGVALALPEVCEGCAALVAALDSLSAAVRDGFVETDDAAAADAACAVLEHAGVDVARLTDELSRAAAGAPAGRGRGERAGAERGIDARQRLALEASVRRTARELSGALRLSELVIATLELRPTPLDLIDVLRNWSAAAVEGRPVVGISVASSDGRANEVEGDVRAVSGLMELAVGMVSAAGVASPHLAVSRLPDGRSTVRIAERGPREAAPAVALDVVLRDGGERAAAVARVVARRAGVDLVEGPGGRVVTMTF